MVFLPCIAKHFPNWLGMNLFLMCGRCSTMENTAAVCLCVCASLPTLWHCVSVVLLRVYRERVAVASANCSVVLQLFMCEKVCAADTFLRLLNPKKKKKKKCCLQSCLSHRPSTRKLQHVPLHNPCLTHLPPNQSIVLSCSGAVWPSQPRTNEQAHPSILLYSLLN